MTGNSRAPGGTSSSERILLSPPDVGPEERDSLLAAFDSGWVAPAGPALAAFEEELARVCAAPAAVAVSSGTAAMHLALSLVGVRPRDVVLCQSFTFIASVSPVVLLGAEPWFVDSEATTWNMSTSLLAEGYDAAQRQGRRVGAVIGVDLYGNTADWEGIGAICAERGIPAIEDAAEALGSTRQGHPAGTLADIGVVSFNGNKIITTSGGGALLCTPAQATRARHLSTQAREPAPHYEHVEIGFNYRLSNLLAGLGLAQLQGLARKVARRRAIRARYRAALRDDPRVDIPIHKEDNAWLTCAVFARGVDPDAVRRHLDDAGIEARPLWKPMHLQPVFTGAQAFLDGTSEKLFTSGLCLPSGSGMSDDDVDRVIDAVEDALAAASS